MNNVVSNQIELRFSRTSRLIANDDFGNVIKNAVYRANAKHITVLALKNNVNWSRLGVIVGKKKVRKANKRNTIKRIFRESFRHHQVELKGFDVVIIAKNDIALSTKADIRECLEKSWEKLLK